MEMHNIQHTVDVQVMLNKVSKMWFIQLATEVNCECKHFGHRKNLANLLRQNIR
jgi:hypothetical protein